MRILFINTVCGIGSTGRICTELARDLEKQGNEVKIACSTRAMIPEHDKKFAIYIGNKMDSYIHGAKSRIFDKQGFGSKIATKRFLKWATQYNPDLLWLHNIHGYYININLLFEWIKSRPNMKVKWTLHDCWPFTGHCTYFERAGCYKWKTGCGQCVQKNSYPASILFDCSAENFKIKKQLFSNVKNMEIITPSKWLADIVRESFLSEYPVKVCHNTINTEIFQPTESGFRESFNLQDKKIVLGVASGWSQRKGFNDFIQLPKLLGEKYTVVMVGLGRKQIEQLPRDIIGIQRTESAVKLAEIYTAADVFFNPTYEDNYPTVNLEAQACGTPVVSYDTGGCRETLFLSESEVVKKGDLESAIKAIMKKCGGKNA